MEQWCVVSLCVLRLELGIMMEIGDMTDVSRADRAKPKSLMNVSAFSQLIFQLIITVVKRTTTTVILLSGALG